MRLLLAIVIPWSKMQWVQRSLHIGVVIASLMLFGCTKQPDELLTVRIAANPTAFFLPLFVAHDQGMFRRHGLDSKILMLNSTAEATNAFLHGDADVSALGAGGLFFLEQEHPNLVKLVYDQFNRSYSIIVPKASSYEKIEDLKGKRIAIWPSPTPEIYLRLILEPRVGINNFTCVPIESRFEHQAMVQGSVDAIFVADVFATMSIATGESRFLYKNAMEELVERPFFHGGGILRTDFIKANPAVSRQIMESLAEAIIFIHANPAIARTSISSHVSISPEVAGTTAIDDFSPPSPASIARAQELADKMLVMKILTKRINTNNLHASP